MTFDLLVKQGRDRAGYPPESEITIGTNPPDYIARFVERANHQPAAGVGGPAELEKGVPAAVANGPG
jgi:hypothetical protein